MSLLAAIDQGTTGTRCFLFDLAGRVVASAYREHAQAFAHPGWVEHDALEIRDNVDRVVAEAIAAGPREPVLALGVTNQRETVVLWDARSGQLVYFLRGPTEKLTSATFDPSSGRIVTASEDGTVRTYRCDVCGGLDSLVALAKARLAP